jgi:hypothetical protein
MFVELCSSTLFFPRISFTASAAIPPVDITLPAINAALAIHAGHMDSSFAQTTHRSLLIADC